MRHEATPAGDVEPGRYIEVGGPEQALLIPLGTENMRIGRSHGAELHLDESSVSRRHAILVPSSDGVQILDDRSANGTIVNGKAIERAELHDGDVIVIGRVVLRFLEL
jgi:pSer/pThr/pTyr-binding forkhead associated (FHA) protein